MRSTSVSCFAAAPAQDVGLEALPDQVAWKRPRRLRVRLNKMMVAWLVSVCGRSGRPTENLEQVYRRGFASFLRVATAITADQELGRDAVQSAFTAALRHRGSFRGDGTVEAWVWPIVVREARRLARSRMGARPPRLMRSSSYQR